MLRPQRPPSAAAAAARKRQRRADLDRSATLSRRSPARSASTCAPSRAPEPSHARAGRRFAPAPPAEDDLAALLDLLPIAALVLRGDEALYANKTLLDLAGYADLADFRARDGLKAIFRGRDPQALAPEGAVAGIPLVAADERILTVDAQVPTRDLAAASRPRVIAMRRSREAEHQAELRAIERETAMHAARARDFRAALDAALRRHGAARPQRPHPRA